MLKSLTTNGSTFHWKDITESFLRTVEHMYRTENNLLRIAMVGP